MMTSSPPFWRTSCRTICSNTVGRLNEAGVQRGLMQQLGRNARLTLATEIEADRLSIWLMANAGYDPQGAIRFWTRYGKQRGKGIFSAPTHYRWTKRVALFQEEIAKLHATPRQAQGWLPPLLSEPPAPLE
jgi:predicted Zn-dependent protease